jgi:hypothetical protein
VNIFCSLLPLYSPLFLGSRRSKITHNSPHGSTNCICVEDGLMKNAFGLERKKQTIAQAQA